MKNADQDQASTMNRNGTFSKEGQQVYPGMTASQDDFGIQPLSYARRNVEKKPSMRITTSPGNMQVFEQHFPFVTNVGIGLLRSQKHY